MVENQSNEITLNGIPASPGIAIGYVHVIGRKTISVQTRIINDDEIEPQIELLHKSMQNSKEDLQALLEKTVHTLGEESAQIFEIHQLILEDQVLIDQTVDKIRNERINADSAFLQVMESYETTLEQSDAVFFQERASDLRDVRNRVIRAIQGKKKKTIKLEKPSIVFSKEINPSDTANLDHNNVLGFAMDFGGRTSHAAIIARTLRVPSVVGLHNAGQQLQNGDFIILDGNNGVLIINPTQETIKQYEERKDEFAWFSNRLHRLKDLPAITKDGRNIELSANIEFSSEVSELEEIGSDGIGLYRTEYMYLSKDQLPTEEEQYKEFSYILRQLDGKPLVIRTFDLGGDKLPYSIHLPPEENPFLGIRGIRLYRNEGEVLFKTQLRAILRASEFGPVRIMFPMISCVSEIQYCKAVIEEIKVELANENIPFKDNISVGAMIEIPSAAVLSDLIAAECDFLSIGTNDLIQYSLAVDRGNEHIAYLYQPFNPAVLRLIRDIIQKGHEKSVWVGMCGEMASDPLATMILLGLGLDEFSVSPVSLLLIKEIIRRVEFTECKNLANKAMSFKTPHEVSTYLKEVMNKKFKDLII